VIGDSTVAVQIFVPGCQGIELFERELDRQSWRRGRFVKDKSEREQKRQVTWRILDSRICSEALLKHRAAEISAILLTFFHHPFNTPCAHSLGAVRDSGSSVFATSVADLQAAWLATFRSLPAFL